MAGMLKHAQVFFYFKNSQLYEDVSAKIASNLEIVVMKSTILWDISPCSPLSVNLLATYFHAGFLLSLFFRP
jgi:hypothetical protein